MAENPPRGAAPAVPVATAPRVLIVDDHRGNLIALHALLEPLGLQVVSANSGEEALMEVLKVDFALILMDIQMPGLDGFSTTKLIQSRPKSRDIPVVFVSAISREEIQVFKSSVPGFDYLLKPLDPATLRRKVEGFVDLWRRKQVTP